MVENWYIVNEAPAPVRTDRPMPIMGDRLKELRERKNYTLVDMAEYLSITPGGYRKFENGNDPSTERLKQICQVLSCSADYLLGMVDQPWEHLEESKLSPDEKNLLKLYRARKIPRHVRRLLGDLDIPDNTSDVDAIESQSESSVPGQEKTA